MSNLPVASALARGVRYLVRAQHRAGSWTDFWLPVGTSDAWVTAYVGLALYDAAAFALLDRPTRELAADAAHRAAGWLLDQPRPQRGWGYNSTVRPDADTTAHVLSLLARVGLAAPTEAVASLKAHAQPGAGFRTYVRQDPAHQWGRPCPDVTAAALRALYDTGELSGHALAEAWAQLLGPAQSPEGWWQGYWWPTPAYPTGLALELWQLAGRPPLPHPLAPALPQSNAFETAWALLARVHVGGEQLPLVERLVAQQQHDGGWLSAPILRVPPSHERLEGASRTVIAHDARRLFVTASAVRGLALAEHPAPSATLPDVKMGEPSAPIPPPRGFHSTVCGGATGTADAESGGARANPRSLLGRALDAQLALAAQALGFGPEAAAQTSALFTTLSAESLADPCPWPAPQLSSLAAGTPLEYSVTVGPEVRPALRYAAEVGDPLLPAHKRARSATAAVARTAEYLGYGQAWERVLPAVERVTSPELPAPDGLRFWVWSGVDQGLGEGGAAGPAGLKIYLSLLHAELGGGRRRLEEALRAAAIPPSDTLRQTLDALDRAGFPHQFGFGLGPGGRIACKLYYELHGWRRPLVRQLLAMAGLPDAAGALCPEIPGVLRESLAAKRRAGVSLRLDPRSGAVTEITTTAAFPLPLLPEAETARCVARWIDGQGWDAQAYYALAGMLMEDWERASPPLTRLHSLFTRTVDHDGAHTTIYLRPYVASPWVERAAGPGSDPLSPL